MWSSTMVAVTVRSEGVMGVGRERKRGWEREEWGLEGRGMGVGRERKRSWEGEEWGLGGRGRGIGRDEWEQECIVHKC